MAPTKRQTKGRETPNGPEGRILWWNRLLAVLVTTVGPTFLIYVNLRCEKNQCVLYQLPLVLPTHPGAYISFKAFSLVSGFFLLMFFLHVSLSQSGGKVKDSGLVSLLSATLLMLGLAYVRPDLIHGAHAEFLRILVCATILCFGFSAVLATISWLNVGGEKRPNRSWGCLFFRGTYRTLMLGPVELKYFLYVNIGLVAWALLDVLLLLNFALKATLTASMVFLASTQYLVIAHTLLYENFLANKPFVEGERLGFFWMVKVVLYLPFLHSLPVHYAAVTDIMLPRAAMLADCVLFLFGFIIYASSIHQKESFMEDPTSFKGMRSLPANGRRLLISGYWGIVQKPDYFGYMIIWLSWIIACGLSGLSLLVLGIVYMTVYKWSQKVSKLNKDKLGHGWTRYTNIVPKKLIPFVY